MDLQPISLKSDRLLASKAPWDSVPHQENCYDGLPDLTELLRLLHADSAWHHVPANEREKRNHTPFDIRLNNDLPIHT
jgi:hypothetical protein